MGGSESNTIKALASKMEELQQTCARLVAENADLRQRVTLLASGGSGDVAGSPAEYDGVVSRRGMLGKAVGAAVAVAGAVALVDGVRRPAGASTGSNLIAGEQNKAEAVTSVLYDGASAFGGVVLLGNDSSYSGAGADYPAALGGWAGAGATAGKGGVANGIYGFTDNGAGNGVVGVNTGLVAGSGAGVFATASGVNNLALHAVNDEGTAILGSTQGAAGDATAIAGLISSTSPGGFSSAVRGQNNSTTALGIGVWGSQAGSGWGVFATSVGGIGLNANGGTGTGVNAEGSTGLLASGTTTGVQATGPTALSAKGGTVGVSASGPTGVQSTGTTLGVDASGPTAVSAVGTTIGVSASGPTSVRAAGSDVGVQATGPTAVSAVGGSVGVSAIGPTGLSAIGVGSGGQAVVARASSTAPTIEAANNGAGSALRATMGGASGIVSVAAVIGDSKGGIGIAGQSKTAAGVQGHSEAGRGGVFTGGPAQIRLTPGSSASHPASGERGDLFVDKTGRLWFCKKGGISAVWAQVA